MNPLSSLKNVTLVGDLIDFWIDISSRFARITWVVAMICFLIICGYVLFLTLKASLKFDRKKK